MTRVTYRSHRQGELCLSGSSSVLLPGAVNLLDRSLGRIPEPPIQTSRRRTAIDCIGHQVRGTLQHTTKSAVMVALVRTVRGGIPRETLTCSAPIAWCLRRNACMVLHTTVSLGNFPPRITANVVFHPEEETPWDPGYVRLIH